MAAAKGKKKVVEELDYVKTTKRYIRFDDTSGEEFPTIKNFYIKNGALEFDPDKEFIEVAVTVKKKS